MRTLFLLLLLANLAFYAWTQFSGGESAQRDPRPLQQQIAPEQIRILSARENGVTAPAKPDARACAEWAREAAAW